MTKFVTRRQDGTLAAVYDFHLEGVNDEAVPDDDPAIVAFLAAAAPQKAKPTPREWLERLPSDRQQAVVDAMLGNPGAGRLWMVRALGTGSIDVADPETVVGVNDMRAAGILVSDAERDLLLAP